MGEATFKNMKQSYGKRFPGDVDFVLKKLQILKVHACDQELQQRTSMDL